VKEEGYLRSWSPEPRETAKTTGNCSEMCMRQTRDGGGLEVGEPGIGS
jgi:hypothetical protein